LLGLIERLASIVYDIRLLVSLLAQNRPHHVITSITHNFEGKNLIGQLNNGSGNRSLFDPIKSLTTLIGKDEWGIFG